MLLLSLSDMKLAVSVVCCVVLARGTLAAVLTVPTRTRVQDEVPDDLYKLPPGLLFGAGVSATQAEGAWNVDGKAESVMDHLVQNFPSMYQETNEVSAEHYKHYKEDLALAKELKFTTHRFSISWSRIFPTADRKTPNMEAVAYYRDYIKTIRENGMEPFVTMFHFDHPYSLEAETGGWKNRTMVDKFLEYAEFLFETFGDDVKYWSPINEGNMYCIYIPPELGASGIEFYDPHTFYECLHNTILAHAYAYRLYKEKFYKTQQGKVGISVLMWPATPNTQDYKDSIAADIFNNLFSGTAVDPVVHGDYPPLSRYLIDKRSNEMGLQRSRLPHFTSEEKTLLAGGSPATDFIALNLYSGFKVEYVKDASDHGVTPLAQELLQPVLDDMEHVKLISGGTFDSKDDTLMRTALLWSWNRYHLPIIITENGYGDGKGHGIHDSDRAEYFRANIGGLVRTANEFSIPIISYHAWSLLDVFEFSSGYEGRPFGLIHVDYKNKTLKRTLKDSSTFFIEMAETRRVPSSSQASTLSPPTSTLSPPSSTQTPSGSSSVTSAPFLLIIVYSLLTLTL
ncbi:myrosinase 1-like [Frankliniella occidentalis]|uniref:Myrosinase 1-like n=1 Tax=Frankliniella occidentalis TaxID=133901 RepID=A0A9C6X6Z8_FRAOC|nr:myrosinase 1-like [Frankliniella occidentalis]